MPLLQLRTLHQTDMSCGVALAVQGRGFDDPWRTLLNWYSDMVTMDRAAALRPEGWVSSPYRAPAIILFSDTTESSNRKQQPRGRRWAKFIEDYNLGKVMKSDPVRNNNTGRTIEVFMYHVDLPALAKFFEDESI